MGERERERRRRTQGVRICDVLYLLFPDVFSRGEREVLSFPHRGGGGL